MCILPLAFRGGDSPAPALPVWSSRSNLAAVVENLDKVDYVVCFM